MKRTLTTIIGLLLISWATVVCQASEDEQAWGKVINLAEALIGEGSFLDAKGAEGKLDALIDLHVAFYTEMTGNRIPSQRVMATKQGMRLFLKTAGERYEGDKRKAILRLLRDLATNRAVFIEILTSDSPSEVIEQQMMAYLERNQGMSYKDPMPIADQISVPQPDTPLEIVEERIRLVSDSGTSGHYNEAIDAGEVITLNIPLKNISDSPFRSTSGFLQTQDKYVRVGNSEVVYTERSEIDGQTVTFAPGKSITPSQHFVFTLSPDCPDGHKIDFILLAWDSDRGKHEIPFAVTAYHVGPLDFGSSRIDDDIPGPSNGNSNAVLEPGEIIEYVLSLQNRGNVLVEDISANLFSASPIVDFQPGDDTLKYKRVEPNMEQPISSSFVFSLYPDDPAEYSSRTKKITEERTMSADTSEFHNFNLRILLKGMSRGHNYSWIQTGSFTVGVSDAFYLFCTNTAQSAMAREEYMDVIQILGNYRLLYRVNNSPRLTQLRKMAEEQFDIKERERIVSERVKEAERVVSERISKLRNTAIESFSLKNKYIYREDGRAALYWVDGQEWSGKFEDRHGNVHQWVLKCHSKQNNQFRQPVALSKDMQPIKVSWTFTVGNKSRELAGTDNMILHWGSQSESKHYHVDNYPLRLVIYGRNVENSPTHYIIYVALHRLDYEVHEDILLETRRQTFTGYLRDDAIKGNLELVKMCIEKGADINGADTIGNTALMWASAKGHLDVVKFLVENGAKVNAKSKEGKTALDYATDNGHTAVKTLLQKH